MAIFNSYVKLPEGTPFYYRIQPWENDRICVHFQHCSEAQPFGEVAASITAGTRRKRPHFLAFFRGEWRWEDDGKLMENDEKLMENDETPLEMRIWKSEISPLGRLSGFQVQSRRILELWIQWRQTEITTASQRVNVNGSCNWTPLHIKILYASKLWDTWHAKLFQGLHQQ